MFPSQFQPCHNNAIGSQGIAKVRGRIGGVGWASPIQHPIIFPQSLEFPMPRAIYSGRLFSLITYEFSGREPLADFRRNLVIC